MDRSTTQDVSFRNAGNMRLPVFDEFNTITRQVDHQEPDSHVPSRDGDRTRFEPIRSAAQRDAGHFLKPATSIGGKAKGSLRELFGVEDHVQVSEPATNTINKSPKSHSSTSLAKLRHKMSAMFNRDASGQGDNSKQTTDPMPPLPTLTTTQPNKGETSWHEYQWEEYKRGYSTRHMAGPTTLASPVNSSRLASPTSPMSPVVGMGTSAYTTSPTGPESPSSPARQANLALPAYMASPADSRPAMASAAAPARQTFMTGLADVARPANMSRPAYIASPADSRPAMTNAAAPARQTFVTSPADVARPADMASPAKPADSTYITGPTAKAKPVTRKPVPILILDTNVSAEKTPISSVNSSAHTKSTNQTDLASSTTATRDFAVSHGPSISLPVTPQKAHKDGLSIYTRNHAIKNEVGTEHLQETVEVSSRRYLIANLSSSSLVSPAKGSKVLRPFSSHINFLDSPPLESADDGLDSGAGDVFQNTSNVNLPKTRLTYRNCDVEKGTGRSHEQKIAENEPLSPESPYRNWDSSKATARDPRLNSADTKPALPASANRKLNNQKGFIRSTGRPTPAHINPEGLSMYSLPPPPETTKCNQILMPASTIQRSLGDLGVNVSGGDEITSPYAKNFQIPRKTVASGSSKIVPSGEGVQSTVQGKEQRTVQKSTVQSKLQNAVQSAVHGFRLGGIFGGGAKGKEPEVKEMAEELEARAKMERDQFVDFQIKQIRDQTGSQIVWYQENDLRCKHPNHHRTWYSKNLWCIDHTDACARCFAPCCALVGATKIVQENKAHPQVIADAKELSEEIKKYMVQGYEEATFMECSQCYRLVCPECCSVCPIEICGDRVCKECNPDKQWEPCGLH